MLSRTTQPGNAIEHIAPPHLHEAVLEIISTIPGSAVLDLPTGYGALAQKLLDAGMNVTACDIDVSKFKGERTHALLKLQQIDMNETMLPLPENRFDIVISVEGIEHLQRQWDFIRNLFRVLKPGGHLILTTPNILNIRSRLRYFMEGRYEHFKRPLVKNRSWKHDLDNYHIAPISYYELQFMLESSEFEIVSVTTNQLKARNTITRLAQKLFHLFCLHKNWRDGRRKRGNHAALYATILSEQLFFGECLIVVAKKAITSS